MVVYLDSSALLGVLFGEPSAAPLQTRLNEADEILSSNLLEAELRAAFHRENVPFDDAVIASIGWILPQRALAAELATVLKAGYLRGADLWHLACALYVTDQPQHLAFLTMDTKQRAVAHTLGFNV